MSDKKKAIVFTRFPYESAWGGEESHTITLAKYFHSRGFEPVFFGSCPMLLQKFSELGFSVRKVWGAKMIVTLYELLKSFFLFPFIRWNMRRQFRRLLSEFDVQALVCLSFNEKLFLTPLALEVGIPVTWLEHEEIRGWLLKSPWKYLYSKYSKHVKIVPISRHNHDQLKILGVEKKSITEIINGVDVRALTKLKRKTQKNLIVTANRNIPKKGIQDFLKALELMHRNDLIVRVISDFLKKENWYDVLSKADVYVLASRNQSETFSLSTAEAMAAGCKVVVTKCCGIADFLEDKKNAFLVEPNNPKDLARGIEEALLSSDELRESARALAKEKFDQEKMFQAYESVILRS